jgi:hypothetical protein
MDKKPINEGIIRSNIKIIRDGVEKGNLKPTQQIVKPPPPPPPKPKTMG